MKKKILAVMLPAVLAVTMLVGCGDSVETSGGVVNGEPEARAEDAQSTETESTNSDDLLNSINEQPKEWQQRQWLLIHVDGQGKSKAVVTEDGRYTGEHERASLDNLFIEYDQEGEICKSNINFIDYPTFDEDKSTVYTYKYDGSDLTVTSTGGKNTSDEYTLTSEGRVIKRGWTLIYVVGGTGTGFVKQLRNKPTETKNFSYNYVEKASNDDREYYSRRYTDSTLGSFAVRIYNRMTAYSYTENLPTEVIYVTDGKESSCNVTEDDYGNIVMTESDQIFYFTYAYLTIDEYMNYLETGDLEGIKVSGYTGRDYNYESILSDSSEIEKNVTIEIESNQGKNNTANGEDTNTSIDAQLLGFEYCYVDGELYEINKDTLNEFTAGPNAVVSYLMLYPVDISTNLKEGMEEGKNAYDTWAYDFDLEVFLYPGTYYQHIIYTDIEDNWEPKKTGMVIVVEVSPLGASIFNSKYTYSLSKNMDFIDTESFRSNAESIVLTYLHRLYQPVGITYSEQTIVNEDLYDEYTSYTDRMTELFDQAMQKDLDTNVGEDSQTRVKMTEIEERETAVKVLLEAMGFTDVVVSINNNTVDVVVNVTELDETMRAKIEDIVKRKTDIPVENIIITTIEQ